MDIQVNNEIYNGLKEYNSKLSKNYGNSILELAPREKKVYPYTIFQTIRDTSIDNSCYGKRSSKGYRVDIYAQDKGKFSRKDIAQILAQQVDYYLSDINLKRVSYNEIDLENNGTTYHIIMTYSGELDEYRRKFI